jgi:hypothetical protein
MKFAVLLTSCVRSHKKNDPRMSYYLRAINDWLNKTELPIFIVESSGYNFPEFKDTRLKVCTFDLINEPSSSHSEAKSILYAMEQFKNEFQPYTHILKVTARYFVDVEKYLSCISDVDIILQSQVNHEIKWNNSEIFGFRIGCEKIFLQEIIKSKLMEHAIYLFSQSQTFDRLPKLQNIYKVRRGGDDQIIDPL